MVVAVMFFEISVVLAAVNVRVSVLLCDVQLSLVWLRFARKLQEHNDEFNRCNAVEPSRKRASDADSSQSKRPKLEGLEEANLTDLMKVGPLSIAEHAQYLLLSVPAEGDSAGTVWIASKGDMDLDANDILFSFGAGRR